MAETKVDTTLTPAKPWWKSNTIWGIVITLVISLGGSLMTSKGIDPSVLPDVPENADYKELKDYAEQMQTVTKSEGTTAEKTSALIPVILAALTGAFAIYSRAKSGTVLTPTVEKAVVKNNEVEQAKNALFSSGVAGNDFSGAPKRE